MCVPKGFGNIHGWALCLVTNAFTSLEICLKHTSHIAGYMMTCRMLERLWWSCICICKCSYSWHNPLSTIIFVDLMSLCLILLVLITFKEPMHRSL